MADKKLLDVQQLRREYEAGDSLQTIADRHEVSGPVVGRRLRAAGVQLRPAGCGYRGLDVEAMRREYEAGDSFRTVARRHGVTYGTARNWVLDAGARARPRGAGSSTAGNSAQQSMDN